MALHIRFAYDSGWSLGYSIERLADGLFYDFGDSTFKASPGTLIAPLPEDTGVFMGRYKLNLTTPAATFPDGDYVVSVHHTAEARQVVAQLAATLHDGDDSAPASPYLGNFVLTGTLTPSK